MRLRRKLIALLLCLSLLPAAPALAEVLGEPVDGYTVELAEGVSLTETAFWTGSDARTEHYLTLAPGGAVAPVAVSCDPLWSRQQLTAAAAALEAGGLHVLGGSNGGFYTLNTAVPVGLVMSEGQIRSDDEGLQAVGFRTDGSVIFGKPALCMTLKSGEMVWPVAGLNRVGGGLQIYTSDCTKEFNPGTVWAILCTAEGELRPNSTMKLSVESVSEPSGKILVPEGKLLLTLEKTDLEAALPESLQVGAAPELEISCASGWETVDSAVGILYPLVENGAVLPGLLTDAAPRTAIGVKADGTMILYTVDGRQLGYSVGAGLRDLAQRMLELGCVTAGALDGGDSTQMKVQLPGDQALETVNRPSGKTIRSVVNYILVATTATPTGMAERLTLYPLHIDAVAGAKIPLTVKASDKNGYAASVPEDLNYSVSNGLGEVKDGVFYAAGTGDGTVTVSAPGLKSAVIPIHVTASPAELALYGEKYGKLTQSLTLEPGQAVDLTVRSRDNHVLLSGDDSCYTWTLEPEVGTVDATGHLIPAEVSGSGTLTVTAGESSVKIPIKVWSGVPFRDVKPGDACFTAVKYVYDHGIFEGTGETVFDPATVMNRGMLVTVLWRMSGKPEAAAPAAFADVAADAWYGPAVAWAAETGLVNGYSETAFGPADDLTREQILTILHRWAETPAAENPPAETVPGLAEAHEYALPALCWALERGVVAVGEEGLKPLGAMGRADVAEVLMRYLELPPAEKIPEN